jgi:hypothetical protein
MGFDSDTTRFLLYAKRNGVDFVRTATIGRQFLYLNAAALASILRDFGYSLTEGSINGLLSAKGGYAEPLLHMVGATEICTFDATAYEGASHLHDFNLPIPEELCNRFTVVIDGGSLEHIFNFPVAIKNCMQMLEVGGYFIGLSPGNNWFGHGFYQFSPDLFFRVFSRQNGFEIVRALVCERNTGNWFEVIDPETINRRVGLINARETYMLTLARRVEDVPILSIAPQQSDYVAQWTGTVSASAAPASHSVSRRLTVKLLKSILSPFKPSVRRFRAYRARLRPRFDPRCFKRVTIP